MENTSEKKLLERIRSIFAYSRPLKQGTSNECTQLNIENVCNEDRLKELEQLINVQVSKRELIINDELMEEIAFMMVRMCDYVDFSLSERKSIIAEREEMANLKVENERLKMEQQGYNESFDKVKAQHDFEIKQLKNDYDSKINALTSQIDTLIQEKMLQQKVIDSSTVQLIQKEEQIVNMRKYSSGVQSSLDSLNIEMENLKAIHQGQLIPTIREKSLKGLLTAHGTKDNILQYLSFSDTLNVRLLNREFNLIITRDFNLHRLLITHISSNYNRKTQQLFQRANFFSNLAGQIPGDVLKVSILKYLCQRHQVGEVFQPSLSLAQNIFDGSAFADTGSVKNNEKVSASMNSSQIKSAAMDNSQTDSGNNKPNNEIDLLSDVHDQPQIQQNEQLQRNQEQQGGSQIKQQIPGTSQEQISNSTASSSSQAPAPQASSAAKSSSSAFSFMKKLFENTSTSSKKSSQQSQPQQQSQIPNSTAVIAGVSQFAQQVDKDQANQLLLDMSTPLEIDQRIMSLFLEESDVCSKQLKIEIDEAKTRISQIGKICLTDPKKVGLFLDTLENNLCSLYIFGKFLFTESKALYDLLSYLSYELMKNKLQLQETHNQLEDVSTSKQALEKMKEYLSARLKETEKKNLQNDTIFLKNTKIIAELKDANVQLTQRADAAEKAKHKSDTNLKILAKEVRNQLRKIADLNEKYQKLLEKRNYLKDALSNFKIIEE